MPKVNASTAAGLLARVPSDQKGDVTVHFSYEAGLFAHGVLADVLAYGRSLGLDIQNHRGGGLLMRRGRIVARGPWPKLALFLRSWTEMEATN